MLGRQMAVWYGKKQEIMRRFHGNISRDSQKGEHEGKENEDNILSLIAHGKLSRIYNRTWSNYLCGTNKINFEYFLYVYNTKTITNYNYLEWHWYNNL